MTDYLGDFPINAMIDFKWSTNAQDGASMTRSTDGTLRIYKGNSAAERSSLVGVTQTEDFDTTTGVHHVRIDLSDNTDVGFYAAGNEYHVIMAGMVIDTKTVNAVIASFSIERAGGVLALLKAGTVVTRPDWANIQNPTSAVNLSGTNIDVDQVVASVSGAVASVTGAVGSVASGGITAASIASDAITAAKIADGAIDAATFAAGAITAAAIAADAIGASELAADAVSEIQAAVAAGTVASVTGNVGGNVVGSVGSVAANGIAATSIATGAITAAKFAASAIDAAAIASNAFTTAKFAAGAFDAVWTVATRALTDKVGFALSAAGVQAIWDALTSALTTVGSIGKLLVDNVNATISSRSTYAGGDTSGTTTLLGQIIGTLAAGTHNPQGGDTFARLGAPVGASISVDIAAVKTDSAAIKTKTDNLPSGIAKNTALNNFEFVMVDSTDHLTPKTGLTITAQRSIDGAAFAACANSATEVANGVYKINLAASDLNGDVVTFRFTGTGSDARLITIVTEP